jgi:hypothetical protein
MRCIRAILSNIEGDSREKRPDDEPDSAYPSDS